MSKVIASNSEHKLENALNALRALFEFLQRSRCRLTLINSIIYFGLFDAVRVVCSDGTLMVWNFTCNVTKHV